MPTKTKIEWCDYISNPIKASFEAGPYPLMNNQMIHKTGHACVKVSEGCAHCWASTFNVRLGTGLPYTMPNLARVNVFLDEKELERLLNFVPKPPFKNGRSRALLFPCDMTDLFGEWVPREYMVKIFNAFYKVPDVDFVILTKRPQTMLDFIAGAAPLRNVILGVSIEDQQRAMARWSAMCQISARGWRTAVSYEPALGPVNWDPWDFVNWMICGGESGSLARPMSPLWARDARDFATECKIPFFFKQWGEFAPARDLVNRGMQTFKRQPFAMEGGMVVKVGKVVAGHVLDGKEWRQVP